MNEENQVPTPAASLSTDDTTSVPMGRLEDLCRILSAETDLAKQRHYWALLRHSGPSSKALDLALSFIMNSSAPNRGEAIRYLRVCFPDRLPGLLEAFSKDPDEELRYQLSEFLRDSDQDAAVGMKISMLRSASAPMQEILIAEIAEFGSLVHLEALHGLKDLVGKGADSAFARAAEQLAKRTRSQADGGA